jgi:hypothetical protein
MPTYRSTAHASAKANHPARPPASPPTSATITPSAAASHSLHRGASIRNPLSCIATCSFVNNSVRDTVYTRPPSVRPRLRRRLRSRNHNASRTYRKLRPIQQIHHSRTHSACIDHNRSQVRLKLRRHRFHPTRDPRIRSPQRQPVCRHHRVPVFTLKPTRPALNELFRRSPIIFPFEHRNRRMIPQLP